MAVYIKVQASINSTREKQARRAKHLDQRVWGGPNIYVTKPEATKRGATKTKASISGKRTTLGDLIDASMDRADRLHEDVHSAR